jgi:cytochrome c-type biogenesis protein CcmH
MSSWIPIIVLALLAFLVAAFALKLPRKSWALLGAVLFVGLAGYSWQGSPDEAAAPARSASEDVGELGWQVVDQRLAIVGTRAHSDSRALVTADAMMRQGRFGTAAAILRAETRRNPNDAEVWLALGNALTFHAEGRITPAVVHAYRQSQIADPRSAGPSLYMGYALLDQGKLIEAHQLWSGVLANAPENADWRPELERQLATLEAAMRQIVADAMRENQGE